MLGVVVSKKVCGEIVKVVVRCPYCGVCNKHGFDGASGWRGCDSCHKDYKVKV